MITTQQGPVYHHCGLVRFDDQAPTDKAAALAWIYRSEEILVDLVWQVMSALASRRLIYILDAGCGQGGALARFAKLAAPDRLELTGITLRREQSDVAAQYLPQATWLVGDMLADPRLPAGRFDAVVALQSTEYIGASKLDKFMARVASWLAPRGLLAVVAGSWSPALPAQNPLVKLFERLHPASLAATDDYRQAAKQAKLRSLGELDLAPGTLNYWRVRRDCPALRRSPDGAMEHGFYMALKKSKADYRLYVWGRPG